MFTYNKFSFILLFLVGIFLTACNKENLDEIVPEDPNFQPEMIDGNSMISALRTNASGGLDLGCLTIEYPFELLLESGETVNITSEAEFIAAAEMEAPNRVVDFVFPLNVTDLQGNTFQVNNNVELGTSFGSCVPDDGWVDTTSQDGTSMIPVFLFEELCFDLVYPVDVEDADENTYTANDEAELIDLLATKPNLSFVLPITVVDQEGNQTIITSSAGFFDLYYSCDGVTPPGGPGGIVFDINDLDSTNCDFDTLAIQFPYDVLTDNGELITVQNANQEASLMLSGEHYTIQFPFSMLDKNGEVVTINTELEFIELILPCLITIGEPDPCSTPAHVLLFFNTGNGPTGCGYTINYPAQVEAEGVTYDLNDMNDYWPVYNLYSNQIDAIDIVYPISVTKTDGSIITFNSDQEICDFIDACG